MAADGEEVDGEPPVVVVPNVELVPPGFVLLEMLQEGIMDLGCGSPVSEGRAEGVVGQGVDGGEGHVVGLAFGQAHRQPSVAFEGRWSAAVLGKAFRAFAWAFVRGKFGCSPGMIRRWLGRWGHFLDHIAVREDCQTGYRYLRDSSPRRVPSCHVPTTVLGC